MQEKNKNTKKPFKKISPFYIVLALCLCAAGVTSVYSAKYRIKTSIGKGTSAVSQAEQTETAKAVVTVPVGDIVTNVPDERYEATEYTGTIDITVLDDSSEEASEEIPGVVRAAQFVKPMDTDVLKKFSAGQLVQSKTMGDWRTHNGTDFKGNTGDPVKAVNNGRVVSVYDDALWGTVVEIDHGDGLTAKYCGLGKGSTVSVGDEIKINDKVGNLSVVPAESADETHLHIEVTQDDEYVDFESLLPHN